MPRTSAGPKLWFDVRRQSWTICHGRKRQRVGVDTDPQRALSDYIIGQHRAKRRQRAIMPEPVDDLGTPLVSLEKASELLGLTRDELRRDIDTGRMPAVMFGKSWFVRRAWIERALAGPRLPPSNDRSGVYIAGFGPYVKIGISVDVDQRFSQLQTPESMEIYALLRGGLDEEMALHRRFAAYRLNGEWFRKEGELAQWIDGGCND